MRTKIKIWMVLVAVGVASCKVQPRSLPDTFESDSPAPSDRGNSDGGNSDEGDSTEVENSDGGNSPGADKDLSLEERELLEYCEKVQEISEKQEETDRKLEVLLTHVEGNPEAVRGVSLNEDKKQALKEGWEKIEKQKKDKIKQLSPETPQAL